MPQLEATAENESVALASVYAFVLRCAEEKKRVSRPGDPDDAKEIKNGCAATPEYNR